ncbi:hypothetical protein NUQ48_06725 [Glaesserella parasuis]|nr:hypothetical protein [Glaesserella parasuis]
MMKQLMLWGFAFLGTYLTAYASPKIPQALLTDSLVYCTSASGFSSGNPAQLTAMNF